MVSYIIHHITTQDTKKCCKPISRPLYDLQAKGVFILKNNIQLKFVDN